MRASQLGFMALMLPALIGCGTLHNLKDPPNGVVFVGTGRCYPFGGVLRSSLLGICGPPIGLAAIAGGSVHICQGNLDSGFKHIGEGALLTPAGLVALADIPLSLGGDILTLPIAYARYKGHPWATWWGEKSSSLPTIDSSGSDEGDRKLPEDAGAPDSLSRQQHHPLTPPTPPAIPY